MSLSYVCTLAAAGEVSARAVCCAVLPQVLVSSLPPAL